MLSLAIAALANRSWGYPDKADSVARYWAFKAASVLAFAFAAVLHRPDLWIWAPAFALGFVIFRAPAVGESWLAAVQGRNVEAAIWRGLYALPYAMFIGLATDDLLPAFCGLAFFAVFGGVYYVCGRLFGAKAVDVAELICGILLVSI